MKDSPILDHIAELVTVEQRIREHGARTPDEIQRLHHVGEQLDQCWDLLRQRRARREFGDDPASARVRDVSTIERYQG